MIQKQDCRSRGFLDVHKMWRQNIQASESYRPDTERCCLGTILEFCGSFLVFLWESDEGRLLYEKREYVYDGLDQYMTIS